MAIKKIIHEYNGILLDSLEEKYFAAWCEELKTAGYIKEWRYITNPVTITKALTRSYTKITQLKTKVKEENKEFTLLAPLTYTPDFAIDWTEKGMLKFVSCIYTYKDQHFNPKSYFFSPHPSWISLTTYVEIKAKFDLHGKTARFSIIQKILWKVKGIFVDLILIEDLFKDTFMPIEIMEDFKYKKSPTGKNKGKKKVGDWKTDYIPKTINEFLECTI